MQKPITPMMRQYLEIKEQYKDCLLFFRLGDFYELFFDDAKVASEELELTLTGRNCGQEERAPMCGVPFHSVDSYIARLIQKGYKVAICEQMEDPATAKDLVRRDVVRVITPGTANLDLVLNEAANNFLASVYLEEGHFGVCFTDVSTGELFATEGENDLAENSLANTLACFKPSEIIVNDRAMQFDRVFEHLKKRFHFYLSCLPEKNYSEENAQLLIDEKFGIDGEGARSIADKRFAKRAVGGALGYLNDTQKVQLSHISQINYYTQNQYMDIDMSSRRNLELTETMRAKSKRGSLLGVLDKTKTSMGARLLRKWLEQPLLNVSEISQRLDAVEELVDNIYIREDIIGFLRGIQDIERIISKIVYGSANARDFVALKHSLVNLPPIIGSVGMLKSEYFKFIHQNMEPLEDLKQLIDSAFVDEPPVTIREGGMIKAGFDKELDRLRTTVQNGSAIIAEIESKERESTGIKNLKVSYNKVFGYYIEITKSNIDKAPGHYIRKQTLTNCERYITQELKEVENTILGANERINGLEYDDFMAVREAVGQNIARVQLQAKLIAIVDALCSLAAVAVQNNYVKPLVDGGNVIDIKDGRHPIVERTLTDSLFVPNSTYLDTDDNRFAIITGPNMAGKSTYMRQTAILVLMAQIGSFVPAKSCHVGVVDKIFTRVGASDDLAAGQSTFMVEMTEVANILKNATKKSLLILDEIGRGTSTFDGLSIAWAVVEYLSDKKYVGAKALFATHYHELTALEDRIEGVKNYSVAVKKRGDDIVFLRKIVPGGTDDSYGIEVAKLAGVPEEVILRAKEILHEIEAGDVREQARQHKAEPVQKSADTELCALIKSYDISTLTPIEALNEIYKLQQKVDELYGEN